MKYMVLALMGLTLVGCGKEATFQVSKCTAEVTVNAQGVLQFAPSDFFFDHFEKACKTGETWKGLYRRINDPNKPATSSCGFGTIPPGSTNQLVTYDNKELDIPDASYVGCN